MFVTLTTNICKVISFVLNLTINQKQDTAVVWHAERHQHLEEFLSTGKEYSDTASILMAFDIRRITAL